MKEICLINKGENIQTINYKLGINTLNQEVSIGEILNSKIKYSTILNGNDDIIVVRNYNPYYHKKLNKDETILDLYALGYEVIGGVYNNKVLIHKTSGTKYTVKPMDKLEDIASRFGVDKEYIINMNNMKTDKLFIGQILVI